MKIKTDELNRLINITYKAAGNNKIIPITQMLGIKLNEGKLTLAATDSFNYLYASKQVESTESIDVCVNADIISKLVSKFTSEFTELVLNDNYLLVKGNGGYKLELLLDDEGRAYKFPVKENNSNESEEIDLVKFTNLKFYAEKSLAQTMEEPDLVAYFVNNEVAISTDRNIMTLYKESITNKPLTLRSKFVDLVSNMKEKVKLSTWNNPTTKELNLYVTDGEVEIFSKVNGNTDDYPYEPIKNLIDTAEFNIQSKVSVKELSSVLDRISLMVTPYDSNVIDLKVSEGKLFISSIKSTGVEVVSLKDLDITVSWAGRIDIEMLKGQLSSFNNDEINLFMGNDSCIKLAENNVTKLICLVEEA